MKYFEVGACLQMLTGVCETSAVSTANKEREGLYGVVLCSDLFSERADDLTILLVDVFSCWLSNF